MQAQGGEVERMMSLFTEDAVYVEPFTGAERTHAGRDAVRAAMVDGWKTPLPDMTISVDRLDVTGGAGLLFGRSVGPAALVVAGCNAFASYGLFAAGVQPFGVISILFVVMALLELRLDRSGTWSRPAATT